MYFDKNDLLLIIRQNSVSQEQTRIIQAQTS